MHALVSVILLAILSFPVIALSTPSALDPAFQKHVAADSKSFVILRDNLRKAAGFARSRPELFSPARDMKKALVPRDDKMAIWGAWSNVLDSLAGLDGLRREHKKFDLFQDSERKNASFTIANASFLVGYRYALEFISLADKNLALDTILNEAVPELGIPAGTFNRFKFRFLNAVIASEFAALQVIDKTYANGSKELRSAIDEDSRIIWEMGRGKGYALTLKQGLRFPITDVMGRKVSTPNGMVKQFDEQSENSAAQAEFVMFLDGFEKERRAVDSTLEQFRSSWQRPNWHILIQDTQLEAKKR